MALYIASFDVLGVRLDALTPRLALDVIGHMVASGTRGYVVFCTVSSVLSARDDPVVARALADATLVTPDGMPLVWLGRRRNVGPVERVYGPDFMLHLLEDTGERFRHYFYGGAPMVAEAMVDRLRGRFPDLQVAGTHSPPLGWSATQVDSDEVERLNDAEADIIWVGFGHPKQELWMHTHRSHLTAPVLAGVGAAFDFHAGRKKEAPEWMKRSGLQWLHRLGTEPRRLWRRYLIGNSRFLYLLAKEGLDRQARRY